MGLVAVLETPEHVATYATHPAHLEYVSWFPVDLDIVWKVNG